jgi:hypothetical protein
VADIFLSYAQDDADTAGRLATLLGELGWSVFWAGSIPAGLRWDETVESELGVCKCVVVLWSAASVKSQWVRTEANVGLNTKTLVPVSLDGTKPPLAFQLVEAAQLRGWTGDPVHPEFLVLTRGISRHVAPTKRVEPEGGSSVLTSTHVPPQAWRIRGPWSWRRAGAGTVGVTALVAIAFWGSQQLGWWDGQDLQQARGVVPTSGTQNPSDREDKGLTSLGSGTDSGSQGSDALLEQQRELERQKQDEAKRIAREEAERKRKETQQEEAHRKQIRDVVHKFLSAYAARDLTTMQSLASTGADQILKTPERVCAKVEITFDGPIEIEFFANGAKAIARAAATYTCWKTTAQKPPVSSKMRDDFGVTKEPSGWRISSWGTPVQ